jgi:hypothetical protein
MSDWLYANNTFVTIARQSRERAITISNYTDAALMQRQSDPFFGPLYTYYHALHEAMKEERTELGAQRGTQKGSTKAVNILLKQLSPEKINEWERQIAVVFAPSTPTYISLLPNGITVFGNRKKDDRIKALRVLAEALTGIAPLAAVKTDVDAFYTQLNTARAQQQGKKSDTKTESTELTAALMAAMTGLYAVLGACMQHFAATPQAIKSIFDIQTIQNKKQTIFIHTVPKGMDATEFIFKRTLKPGQRMKITVLSGKKLGFGITDEKNDPVANPVYVDGLEQEIFEATQLGNAPAAKFFKVRNTDPDVDGHFKIEIL